MNAKNETLPDQLRRRFFSMASEGQGHGGVEICPKLRIDLRLVRM